MQKRSQSSQYISSGYIVDQRYSKAYPKTHIEEKAFLSMVSRKSVFGYGSPPNSHFVCVCVLYVQFVMASSLTHSLEEKEGEKTFPFFFFRKKEKKNP